MATKLAESYVEFFAQGLEETEQATQNLTESSRKAHEAVNALSEKESALEKTTGKVVKKLEQKEKGLKTTNAATKEQTKAASTLAALEGKEAPKKKAKETPAGKKPKLELDTTKAESILGGFWKKVTGVLGKRQEVGVNTTKAEATLAALEKKADILKNKKQMLLIETKRAEATLAAFKAKHEGRIINFLLMINTKKAEATLERIIKKNDGKVINQSVTIDTKKADKALDAFEKKNSVLKDIKQTLVIDTSKAAKAISAFEEKNDGREIRKGIAATKEKVMPKEKAGATVTAIKEKVMPKQKIDMDTSQAESSVSKLTGRIRGLQLATVAAIGGMAIMATKFATAAMANSVEAEQLGKAYEYASKIVGEMFAPYVRLATEMINKFSDYWKSLSEGLKKSIAMWGAITIAAAAFVAVLPIVISVISAVVGGFMAMLTPIGALGVALGAVVVWLSGAAKAGMTWEQRLKAAIRGVLDIWTAMQTAFEMFGDVFSGIFGAIYDTAKGVLVWIAEQFGFVGMEGMAAGDDMSTGLGSSLVWIMEKFGEFKSYVLAIFQVIQKSWASMVDGLAVGMSWVLEKLAIVGEGTTDTLLARNKEQMAQMGTDQKAAMEKLAADNKAILDKMRARMAGNKAKADEYADPLIKLFKGLDAGGGFKIKGTVAFEGLQGSFDRLQLAFANAGGPNIEQAQLVEMKGINQNMQLATAALNVIRDKGPVVR